MGPNYQISTEDLSYSNHMPSFSADDDLSTIVPPRRAITKDLPQYLRLQASETSELAALASPSMTASASSRLGPLLSRASSALSLKSSPTSRQSSPVRRNGAPSRSPLRESICEDSSETYFPSPRSSKLASTAVAFSELFQGTSELVNTWSFKPQETSFTKLTKPTHSRSNTSKSFGSSLFSGWTSPQEKESEEEVREEDDEIMNLNIDEALFRGSPGDSPAEAMDNLIGNAERLFMQMQIAHSRTLKQLNSALSRVSDAEEDLEEERQRSSHLKMQLSSMDKNLSTQEERCTRLQAELDKAKWLRRVESEHLSRTIRPVTLSTEQQPTLNIPGKDGHRLFSGERDSMYSLTQAGLELSSDDEESSAGESALWSPPLTPEASRRASSDGEAYMPSTLMQENLALKARILELEDTVEGCLGLVDNL